MLLRDMVAEWTAKSPRSATASQNVPLARPSDRAPAGTIPNSAIKYSPTGHGWNDAA